jgi:2-polyprenyl-6-hydroxyphenyl methylase/3-demethylubiquinone-9 3-methyltransferase
VFQELLDQLPLVDRLWLDLGCGPGVLTRELVARGARVVAVDGSPAMLQAARDALAEADDASVAFRLSSAADLSWAEAGDFDGVLCSSVIEYVESPGTLLAEVSRVMKPGGTLILSVPPRGSLLRTRQKIARSMMRPLGIDRHAYLEVSKFELEPRDAAQWFDEHGLRVERTRKFDPLLPPALLSFVRPALMIYEVRKRGVTPA